MSQSLTLVFCGTPRFAVPTLEALVHAGFPVGLVVTQPDSIKNNDEFRAQLTALKPDAIIVVGYGRIIPQWMIDLPRFGNINLHASLLPNYRGAAPIQWAVARGEIVTGVTTMRIDAGLDTGDILMQTEVPIELTDTAETLAPALAAIGAGLMVDTLRGLQAGTIAPRPQDHAKATLAPILKKQDGRIDFRQTAQEICNRLRGFQPWPGAFAIFRGKNLHVWQAAVSQHSLPPGELRVESNCLFVGCGEGTALALFEVQLEGKKRMPAGDFVHGYRPQSGEKLGL